VQTALFLICTIPFWTSNVIRMISAPLLPQRPHQPGSPASADQPLRNGCFRFRGGARLVHLYTLFIPCRSSTPCRGSKRRCWKPPMTAARVLADPVERRHSAQARHRHRLDLRHHHRDGRFPHRVSWAARIASIGKVIQVEMSYLHSRPPQPMR
jgi:hypothetical protein